MSTNGDFRGLLSTGGDFGDCGTDLFYFFGQIKKIYLGSIATNAANVAAEMA